MSKSIYEEAIADAKKIREAAEVNAKNAILESVTPKIREFIEQAILEQDQDSENSPNVLGDKEEKEPTNETDCMGHSKEEAVALDESAISALLGLLGGEDVLNDLSTGSSKRAMNSVVNEAIGNLSKTEREKFDEQKKPGESFDSWLKRTPREDIIKISLKNGGKVIDLAQYRKPPKDKPISLSDIFDLNRTVSSLTPSERETLNWVLSRTFYKKD